MDVRAAGVDGDGREDRLRVFGDLPPEERERSRRRRKEIMADPELMKELMSQIRDIPWPDGYDPNTQTTLDDWR